MVKETGNDVVFWFEKNNTDTFLEVNEFFKFVKIHADDKNLQFDLTSDEIEMLLQTLGYYQRDYGSNYISDPYISIEYAEWINFYQNENASDYYKGVLKHLCKLSLMEKGKGCFYKATELGKKVTRIKYVQYVKDKLTEYKNECIKKEKQREE